jgi:hypothetical protein
VSSKKSVGKRVAKTVAKTVAKNGLIGKWFFDCDSTDEEDIKNGIFEVGFVCQIVDQINDNTLLVNIHRYEGDENDENDVLWSELRTIPSLIEESKSLVSNYDEIFFETSERQNEINALNDEINALKDEIKSIS